MRAVTLLALALAAPAAVAQFSTPEHLGVYVLRSGDTLAEIPPVDAAMRQLLGGLESGVIPPELIARLEAAVLAPDSTVVVYEPGVPIQDFLFLRVDPRGTRLETLQPRIRPGARDGLWIVSWREPLSPGMLVVTMDTGRSQRVHMAQITASGLPEPWPTPPGLIPMPPSPEAAAASPEARAR